MYRDRGGATLKYWWFGFLIILLAAIVVRVVALYELKSTPYYRYLLYDEYVFHSWAVKIATGVFSSQKAYQFAPLFPYIMAGIYKLISINILYIRVLNIIIGVVTCSIFFFIARELAGKKAAFIALVIGAFYEPHILYCIVPLKAALATFLFSLTVYWYLSGKNKASSSRIYFCGIALGLLLNIRPQAGVLMPVIVLLLIAGWKEYPGKAGTAIKIVSWFVLGVICVVFPFILRNYLVASTLSLTTTQAGFNFYRANKVPSVDVPVNFAETRPEVQETQFRIEASRRVGRKLSSEEASTYWENETFRVMRASPGVFIENIVYKTLLLFKQHQLTDQYSIQFMRKFIPLLSFQFFSFDILMPLGMAGLFLLVLKAGRGKDLLIIFVAYASTLVIFFMRTRYRLPLISILIPCSAFLIVHFHAILLNNRRTKDIALCIAFFSFFLALTLWPTPRGRDFTAYLNGHALALKASGKIDSAVSYWLQSSNSNGLYSDFANLSLAGHFLKKRKYEEVKKYLGRISNTSYAIAQKYLLLGEMQLAQHKFRQAVVAYQMSLEYNSGEILPLRRLVMIFQRTNDPGRKNALRRLKYIKSFYSSQI